MDIKIFLTKAIIVLLIVAYLQFNPKVAITHSKDEQINLNPSQTVFQKELIKAAEQRNSPAMSCLIDSGVQFQLNDDATWSKIRDLLNGITEANPQVVKYFIDNGCLDQECCLKDHPIAVAIHLHYSEYAIELIKQGEDPVGYFGGRNLIIIRAVKERLGEVLKALLPYHQNEVWLRSYKSRALWNAVMLEYSDMASILLEDGINGSEFKTNCKDTRALRNRLGIGKYWSC